MKDSIDRGQLWREHLRLVEVRAKEVEKQCLRDHGWCPVEFEQLLEAGRDGLTESVQSYDPAKGASFVTHAWHRIRKPMLKRMSEALRKDASLNASIEDAEPEQPYFDGDNGAAPTLHDVVEDEEATCPRDAAQWLFDGSRADETHELIENEAGLTAEEQKIIRQFYGLNSTGKTRPLKQIASKRRISSARASQIKEQALEKIRAAIKRRRAEFFEGREGRDPFLDPL
jgi:RNA polymerase sigma factor (sigma-70 family)